MTARGFLGALRAKGWTPNRLIKFEKSEHARGQPVERSTATKGTADMTDPIIQALEECEEYFDNRQDADCDETGFVPNREMQLLQAVREAQSALLAIQASPAETDRLLHIGYTSLRMLDPYLAGMTINPTISLEPHGEPVAVYAALASLPASEVSK